MTNQTFDFIWNAFGNKELTDSETSSSEASYKANSSVNKNTNAEWRKQEDGYYNRKPNDEKYFQKYLRATAHAADPKDHVCSEYLFSKCQNVGRFFHEVSLASLYHLNSTTSLPMRYSGSKRIWQFARLFSILSEWLPGKRTRRGFCGPNMLHTSASGRATRCFGQSMADTDDNNMSICSVQCNM